MVHGKSNGPRTAAVAQASRREFLRMTGCVAGTALAGSLMGCAQSLPAEPLKVASNMKKLAVFDLHSHLMVSRMGRAALDQASSLRSDGLAGALFSVVPDMPAIGMTPTGPSPARALEPGEAWQVYKTQLRDMKSLAETTPVTFNHARNGESDAADGVVGFIACEGAHLLEGQLARLEQIYEDGVRSLQLVHYVPNDVGDDQTSDSRFGGLSEFGRDVVREANRLGILIDLAHADFKTTQDVLELSSQPVIVSHTILDHETVPPPLRKRALSPDHAKLVAEAGGVIGLWPVVRSIEDYQAVQEGRSVSFAQVHQDFLRLVDLVGPNHVALGSDFGGGPIILGSYAQLDDWSSGLIEGLPASDFENVSSGNAWRILNAVVAP